MLTYLLAIGVGFASFALYMAAFFFPELYRKYDLVWSGVAMFYALVLWVCADRITGGVLLGQMAGTALIGYFGWQTLALRWEQTPIDQRTQVAGAEASLGEVVQLQWKRLWAYLRSDEFKAQLPERLDQITNQAPKILNSAREKLSAFSKAVLQSLSSLDFQSSSQPQSNSQPQSSSGGDRGQPLNGLENGIETPSMASRSSVLHSPLLNSDLQKSPPPDSVDHSPQT